MIEIDKEEYINKILKRIAAFEQENNTNEAEVRAKLDAGEVETYAICKYLTDCNIFKFINKK